MKKLLASVVILAAAGVAQAKDRVLVVPFTIDASEPQSWMAKGVQENIAATLDRTSDVSGVASRGNAAVKDNAAAASLARAAQSSYAVRGVARTDGDAVTLMADLIDARTGDTVRSAAIMGSTSGLLKLEDQLAAQLHEGIIDPAKNTQVFSRSVANLPANNSNTAPEVPQVSQAGATSGNLGMLHNVPASGNPQTAPAQGDQVQTGAAVLNHYYVTIFAALVDPNTGKTIKIVSLNGTLDHLSQLADQLAKDLNGGSFATNAILAAFAPKYFGAPVPTTKPLTPAEAAAMQSIVIVNGGSAQPQSQLTTIAPATIVVAAAPPVPVASAPIGHPAVKSTVPAPASRSQLNKPAQVR